MMFLKFHPLLAEVPDAHNSVQSLLDDALSRRMRISPADLRKYSLVQGSLGCMQGEVYKGSLLASYPRLEESGWIDLYKVIG